MWLFKVFSILWNYFIWILNFNHLKSVRLVIFKEWTFSVPTSGRECSVLIKRSANHFNSMTCGRGRIVLSNGRSSLWFCNEAWVWIASRFGDRSEMSSRLLCPSEAVHLVWRVGHLWHVVSQSLAPKCFRGPRWVNHFLRQVNVRHAQNEYNIIIESLRTTKSYIFQNRWDIWE